MEQQGWKLYYSVTVWLMIACFQNYWVRGEPQVPCYFIFGDSLVDAGNNNYLPTFANVNYPPYGIDFPYGPTGRFTNGRNTIDIIGELIGFEDFIPPFAITNYLGLEILKGVNYGSASAGIRTETGKMGGVNIELNKQITNHETIISRIAFMIKPYSAIDYLGKCLYYFDIGSNDYINNYLIPLLYNTSKIYTPEQYASVLIKQYSLQLQRLFYAGARKVALVPLGGHQGSNLTSTPGLSKVSPERAMALFNRKLRVLVHKLNNDLPGAKFLLFENADTVTSGSDAGNKPCCKVKWNGLCNRYKTPCSDRNAYLLWDSFHPTEATNMITALRQYEALKSIL